MHETPVVAKAPRGKGPRTKKQRRRLELRILADRSPLEAERQAAARVWLDRWSGRQ